MIDTAQAHGILNSIMQQRKQKQGKVVKYKLHATNVLGEVQQTMQGYTIKELQQEFRERGGSFRYAFITNKTGDKLYRGMDKKLSKKWVSYNRK